MTSTSVLAQNTVAPACVRGSAPQNSCRTTPIPVSRAAPTATPVAIGASGAIGGLGGHCWPAGHCGGLVTADPWSITLVGGAGCGTAWTGTAWTGTAWTGTGWAGTAWAGTGWAGPGG